MNPWRDLAREHGPKCVASLSISDKEFTALSAQQIPEIDRLVRPFLRGDEKTALDFGAGCGRFSGMISQWVSGWTYALEPCVELLRHAPTLERVLFADTPPPMPVDVVFTWLVIGSPAIDAAATILRIASALAPNGLLIFGEHCADSQPPNVWWRHRPVRMYQQAFQQAGIALNPIGVVQQLTNPVTVFAGHKA